jgi:hypothetical protein
MAEHKENSAPKYNENTIIGYTFVANTVELMLNRIQKHEDPVIRYTLLLDKFNSMLEIGISVATTLETLPIETSIRIKEVFAKLQAELDLFADYIKKPHISPDHPVGIQILKNGKNSFNSHSLNPENKDLE